MKRIILIIWAILCFTSCEKMIVAIADIATPDPELSFQANGEEFKATGSKTPTLSILNVGDKGFAIIFSGANWDTKNTLESAVISLNCGFFDGALEKGREYVFNSEDMDVYPYLKYTVREELESTPGSSAYKLRTMWYNSTEGRIKITKINTKKGIIAGSFEFTAICDDPSNDDVIEITKGVFKDISYKIVEDLN